MARPKKDGMDYFPHDTDATNDKKIEALRMLYGNDGYAFYFILLEMIYREPNFELDISDAETTQILCRKIGINEEVFEKILFTAIKRECFDQESYHERQILTSNGIKKRAAIVIQKREKMQKYYKEKQNDVSAAETGEETPQSKVKKRKVKESKSKEINKIHYAEFVALKQEEYEKLIEIHGEEMTKECIEILNAYKGSTGKFYKSDYMTMTEKGWVVQRYREEKSKIRQFPNRPPQKPRIPITEGTKSTPLTPEQIAEIKRKAQRLDGREDAG